ncbi:MAG: hydrolase TatD [Rickettsiales bacterium]|nr:hydrolase TatD [Rickettsiales bacterium]
MIDSHCHLDQEPLFNDLNQIISRSKNAGIEKLLTICTTKDSFNKILKIVEFDPMIYGTYGIHPHETKNDKIEINTIVNKISLNKRIIGVGETGLDFYYNNSDKESQVLSFRNHIEASLNLNIPLIIHSRNAETETYEILKDYQDKNLKILMHCFTGSYDFAEKLMKYNSFFSASGIITFKNSLDLQNTFKKIPLNKILIETDSPFLSPIPMRGKKNEPSYIKYTLNKLAQIKNMDSEKIDITTTQNFNKLFFN